MSKGFYSDGRPWPKLSGTLRGPREPGTCARCGSTDGVNKWRECDGDDKPTDVVILVCDACEPAIEKHPRLYIDLHKNAPTPGCMEICRACVHREGVTCTHAMLKANGGPGLGIPTPVPTVFWVDGTTKGGGRRRGWRDVVYPFEPRECAGRQERT